jgi:hypothetical protein
VRHTRHQESSLGIPGIPAQNKTVVPKRVPDCMTKQKAMNHSCLHNPIDLPQP